MSKNNKLWFTHSFTIQVITIVFLSGVGWATIYSNASSIKKEEEDRKEEDKQIRLDMASAYSSLENKIDTRHNDMKTYMKDLLEQRDKHRGH